MRELLQRALDALIYHRDQTRPIERSDSAIAALRAALAAPIPEPVAWAMLRADGLILDVIAPEEHESYAGQYTVPLYAAPPAAPADSQPCTTKPVVSQKAANLTDNADMVMVPREPTPEMLAAILEPIKWAGGVHAYRAMIAAAPPAAPAPAVPEGDVVVSWNEDGQIVAVTRQDREGRILSVIAESAAPVVPLTDERLQKHAMRAGDCPPGSMVVLLSSLRRMLSAAPVVPDETRKMP